MPEPLTTYVTNWRTCYLNLWSEFNNLYNDCYNLGTQLNTEGNPNSSQSAYNMATHILNIRNYFASGSDTLYGRMYTAMNWVDNNIGGGGEVTMDAILSVMITSSFEDLQKFIGIVDAYRVALWNAPFNADFYAALARGFQKWP